MREDFSKVLVERERGGARGDRHGTARYNQSDFEREPEAIPSFESSSRHRGGTKHLNEHLGPLRRFLRMSVGRPWNEVYSELSAHVDRGNAVQAHVFQHLFQYVEVHTRLVDGRLEDSRGRALRSGYYHTAFHVCPTTHVLSLSPGAARRTRWRPPTPSAPQRIINAQTAYRCIHGIWYRLWFEPLPEPPKIAVYDHGLMRRVSCDHAGRNTLRHEYGGFGIFAARKSQLDTRTIQREGLHREVEAFDARVARSI